jgi:hypothetical protein
MKEAKQKLNLDRPATYQIKVQGSLDQSWSDWFNGLIITLENENDDVPTTTLTGAVADQAALRGILSKIWDLNLILISVNRTETNLEREY